MTVEAKKTDAQKTQWLPAFNACMAVDYAGTVLDVVYSQSFNKQARAFFTEKAFDSRAKEQFATFVKGDSKHIKKFEEILPILKKLTISVLHEKINSKNKPQ